MEHLWLGQVSVLTALLLCGVCLPTQAKTVLFYAKGINKSAFLHITSTYETFILLRASYIIFHLYRQKEAACSNSQQFIHSILSLMPALCESNYKHKNSSKCGKQTCQTVNNYDLWPFYLHDILKHTPVFILKTVCVYQN
jgi:glucose-6-phosphate-specific signal transduction histidine kinase